MSRETWNYVTVSATMFPGLRGPFKKVYCAQLSERNVWIQMRIHIKAQTAFETASLILEGGGD